MKGSTMEVALHIPYDVAERIQWSNGQDIARHILAAYAIYVYQACTLSEAPLQHLLGFETQ